MKTFENTAYLDNYYNLFHLLNREDKIKIMARLSLSIVENHDKETNAVEHFFGAFQSDDTAEEIIANIRESRNFNRVVESL